MPKYCFFRKGEDLEIVEVPDNFIGTCEEFKKISARQKREQTPLGFTDDEFIMNSSLIH
jgi:hypothetical protein